MKKVKFIRDWGAYRAGQYYEVNPKMVAFLEIEGLIEPQPKVEEPKRAIEPTVVKISQPIVIKKVTEQKVEVKPPEPKPVKTVKKPVKKPVKKVKK